MSYQETLNLPRTDFPMRAGLPKKEPETEEFWRGMDLYEAIQKKGVGRDVFILHDGPPYANGDIHCGHALNKVLKDVIVRHRTMTGFRSPYVPGWDTHGQPIEHNIEKELGPGMAELSKPEIRKLCREYALRFVQRQSEEFQRLGISGDWESPYLTLHPVYEASIVRSFADLYLKGHIYRGRKPIHWCFHDRTALAEAEIEYADIASPSIHIRFPLLGEPDIAAGIAKPVSLLVWTTTPWTLPANVAVALHPEAEYAFVDIGDEVIVMAVALRDAALAAGSASGEILKVVPGFSLAGLDVAHPIFEGRTSVTINEDFVTLEQGSGLVHIAPGHGQEDHLAGVRHDLPSPMPVDDEGRFTEEGGPYAGMNVFEADPAITSDLKGKGILFASSMDSHSYPHCWRCKQPVIFRATRQWFISMDEKGLRKGALKAISDVDWMPDWNEKRIISMVESRPDWCISRQRNWGVPIPVFHCRDCGAVIADEESFRSIEAAFLAEGADIWFEKEPAELLPPCYKCRGCGSDSFEREEDILDVWFESGVSHEAVLRQRKDLQWPADLYLEGSDQHRGWFQASLLTAVGMEGKAPYRSVLTNGWVVDGEGRAMHKSLGNVISPLDLMEKYGADIIRLWVASTDYTSDMRISDEILDRVSEAYRRIRNTSRFILGNLFDLDEGDKVPFSEMMPIDRYMLHELQELVDRVRAAYGRYAFHLVYHSVQDFCAVALSSFYLDVQKDRLYASAAGDKARRSAQTAMAMILDSLVRLIAPILTFTAEEIWQAMPEHMKVADSVHLMDMPEADVSLKDDVLADAWRRARGLRDTVTGAIEEVRAGKVIGNSLEAALRIEASPADAKALREIGEDPASFFIVSSVEISEAAEIAIHVSPAAGGKCERCWNRRESVGSHADHPGLCDRCHGVVAGA